MSGCILLTEATPEVMHNDKVLIEHDGVVTLADRTMIGKLSDIFRKKQVDIEVADGLSFRDTVFPEGGWKLQDLLARGEDSNLSEKTHVDYLILISPYTELKKRGVLFTGGWTPFMIGYHSDIENFSISAILIDMKSNYVIDKIISRAEGGHKTAGFFLWGIYDEEVVQPVLNKLAEEIIKEISRLKKSEKPRIVIMSLEKPIDLSKENENRLFPYRPK